MDFRGGMLANYPCYNEICMGGPEETNEACSGEVSRYLYGKLIQETCLSRYSEVLQYQTMLETLLHRFWVAIQRGLRHLPMPDKLSLALRPHSVAVLDCRLCIFIVHEYSISCDR